MKLVALLRPRHSLHVLLPVAALLSACGGSPLEDDPMLAPAQLHDTSTQSSGQRAPQQGEFNLDIWNEHRWYECDCARESTAPVGG